MAFIFTQEQEGVEGVVDSVEAGDWFDRCAASLDQGDDHFGDGLEDDLVDETTRWCRPCRW